jgi:hypothetical protein
MWAINLVGTLETLQDQLTRHVDLAHDQAVGGEPDQVEAVHALLESLAATLPPDKQVVISASGSLEGDRGELRIVITYAPAPLGPPAPDTHVPSAEGT